MLGFLHIISSRCQKLGDHAFYIISDISSFRERRRIRDRQRHIQKLRQCLDQIRFSASGRSQHQDVGFLDLRLAALHLHSLCRRIFRVFRLFFHIFICPKLVLLPEDHALIMIVNRHRNCPFRPLLSDHIRIQLRLDLVRRLNILHRQKFLRVFCLALFLDLIFLWNLCIRHLHPRKIIEIHVHKRHILKLGKVHARFGNRIKCFLHTLMAEIHPARHRDHLSRLALRAAADVADFLVIIRMIRVSFIGINFVCIGCCIYILVIAHIFIFPPNLKAHFHFIIACEKRKS